MCRSALYIGADPLSGREVALASWRGLPVTRPLPDADPAWKKAEAEAKAAYEKLKADPNPNTFQALAKKESDDKGSGANGGDLPWAYQSAYDQAFANAGLSVLIGSDANPTAATIRR